MMDDRGRPAVGALIRGVLLSCLLAIAVLSVACDATELIDLTLHPEFNPAAVCSSCKEPLHDYVHDPPYDDPACEDCHSLRSWTRVEYTHANDDFNVSFHGGVDCGRCHTEDRPVPAPACAECHAGQAPHGGPTACEECHLASTAWGAVKPPTEEHVSLLGGHQDLECFDCHDDEFEADPRGCADCHGGHHGGVRECERCHDPAKEWTVDDFDHDVLFTLTGAHRNLECAQCHRSDRFSGTPRRCTGCHGSAHGGLTDCARCHTTSRFVPSLFRHERYFAITGRHVALDCQDCHSSGLFEGTPTWCSGCHGSAHGGLTDCGGCHTTAGFAPSTFVHDSVFTLREAHSRLACTKCHPSGRFTQLIGDPASCLGCHTAPHEAKYTDCESCHTLASWTPSKRIAHPAPVVLGESHASRPCSLCHPSLRFEATVPACQTCHTTPHVGPVACYDCHRPTVWSELHFTHTDLPWHERTDFMDECLYCHPGRNYSTYSCTGCHFPGGVPWDGM